LLTNYTIDELHQKILDNISNEYDKTVGYIIYDVTKTFAIEEKEIQDTMNQVYKQLDIEQLKGDDLERFIYQRKGINRKAATYAVGVVQVTGTGTVTKGAIFETEAGTQFIANETKEIVTTGVVAIRAALGGTIGNVATGTINKMPVTINGIDAVTNADPTHGGYEAETDTSLLDRYYLALRTPPTSGNKYHYLMWSKEVEGVGDAKVYPLDQGANTVTVVIIDAEMKPPDADLITKVQQHIDPGSNGTGEGQAPIGARCFVVGAAAVPVNVSVNVTPLTGYTTEQARGYIAESIGAYLKQIAFKQNYFSLAKVGAIILDCEGVADYTNLELNDAAANVEITDRQVITLGGVVIGS
jgi:uncharacterized phage protein gp47/JayE